MINKKRSECLVLIINLVLAIVAMSVLISLQAPSVDAEGSLLEPTDSTGATKNLGNTPNPSEGGKFGLSWFFKEPSGIGQGFAQGATWALASYFAIKYIGPMIGLSEPMTEALQAGTAAGLGTAGILRGLNAGGTKLSFLTSHPFLSGLVVGAVVFLLTYKEESYKTYTFECQPWEAPLGGDDCELCNDEAHACSEYRCKSLGQSCELANDEDSGYPLCYNAYRGDVNSPSIRVWEDVLTEGYEYSNLLPRPTGGGTKITKSDGQECIDPFTPITFGIETDKPSQCKISFELKEGYGNAEFEGYDDMEYFFGGSNLYDYYHEQEMKLPSPNALESYARAQADNSEEGEEIEGEEKETNPIQGQEFDEDAFEIFNGKEYELYVRCRSPNGYYNADPYIIKFCVEEGDDLTAPVIEEFSIESGSPVQFNVDTVPIVVYTNEPANCWWSESDKLGLPEFKELGHEMECENGLGQMTDNLNYACFSELTNVENLKDNDFYFRCEDQPWMEEGSRIPMQNSEKLILVGTEALNIKEGSLIPVNGTTIPGSTSTVEIDVEIETQNGYKDGESTCYYTLDEEELDTGAIEFEDTGSYKHTQKLYRPTGTYTLFVKCIDLGGNQAKTSTTFDVYYDQFAPVITRVFHNAGKLEIYTDEEAVCYYATNDNTECNFDISDEESIATTMSNPTSNDKTKHLSDWNTEKTYYIKCKEYTEDDTGRRPLPTDCSIIVKPVDN
mgnify:CR=1 FL=1